MMSKTNIEFDGELKVFGGCDKDRGSVMDRGFCSICGSSVLMLIWGCPELSVLSSDTLNDQSIYKSRINFLSGTQCGTIGR